MLRALRGYMASTGETAAVAMDALDVPSELRDRLASQA